MQTLGILIFSLAAWVMYAGWKGFNPADVGFKVIQDPQHASVTIEEASKASQALIQSALGDAATASGADPASVPGAVAASGDGGTVVAFARKQIGKPYVLGGSGPNVWDCSGLVQAAYKLVGISVLHSALAQSLRGTKITSKSALAAGDLLFPTGLGVAAVGDHVQIYSGANTVIEAANPSVGVREIALSHWWPTDQVIARRYIAAKASAPAKSSKPSTSTTGAF